MPRINERGRCLSGVAGVAGSLDGAPLPVYVPQWLDADTVIGQAGSDETGWYLELIDTRDGTVSVVPNSRGGAVVAGGGRYQAFVATQPVSTCYGSLGDKPGAGIYACGPDGTIAWKRDYQAESGLVFTAADGTEIAVDDAVPIRDGAVQVTGRLEGFWLDRVGIRALNRPAPHPRLMPSGRLRLVRSDVGEEWLIYDVDGVGTIAQVNGESVGWVLERRPITFGVDAVASPDAHDEVIVAWSTTQGEAAGDLVKLAVSRRGVRFLVDPDGPARVPPTFGRIVPPTPPIPRIDRDCWLGWYAFGGDAGDAPGNCILPVDDAMLLRDRSGHPIAAYAAGVPDGDVDALDRAVAHVRQRYPGLPVLAYWTAAAQTVRPPKDADIVGVEAYRHADESLKDFRRRVVYAIAAASPRPVVLICSCYTSNLLNDPDLVAVVPVYAQIAHDYLTVHGLLVFSAGTRLSGWVDHPEAREAWTRLFDGITGTPALPAPPPKPKPVPAPAPKPSPIPAASPLKGSMQVYLKLAGHYIGVDPSHPLTVYSNRTAGGAWEEVSLAPNGDGTFIATFVASKAVLSIQPDGSLQPRPEGTSGAYETLYATSQPDGVSLAYRVVDGCAVGVLTVEEAA